MKNSYRNDVTEKKKKFFEGYWDLNSGIQLGSNLIIGWQPINSVDANVILASNQSVQLVVI